MLKSLLKYLQVVSEKAYCGKKRRTSPIPTIDIAEGYHSPRSPHELLATSHRQRWLQMLWDYSSLPKSMYQQYYLQPLEHCVSLMQQFPATDNGHHAYLGGMVDHLLETVAYAARLSKNYLLPVGAPPEEQASQSAAWNAVIVYAAMLQSLDGLCQLDVELQSGKRWMPLNIIPPEPYRFRFTPRTNTMQVQSFGAMLAWKIIPDDALLWLNNWPKVLTTLSVYLTGFKEESGIIHTIVSQAIDASTGQVVQPSSAKQSMPEANDLTPLMPNLINNQSDPVLPPMTTMSNSALGNAQNGELVSALEDHLSASTISPLADSLDTTSELLNLMGYGAAEASQDSSVSTASEEINLGEMFVKWFEKSLLEQSIEVNNANSNVYFIAGYLFVKSPAIFYQFIANNKSVLAEHSCDWRRVQKQFEKQKLHKRQTDGTNVFRCQEKGESHNLKGYLIPAAKIYRGTPPWKDSSLIIIK